MIILLPRDLSETLYDHIIIRVPNDGSHKQGIGANIDLGALRVFKFTTTTSQHLYI